MKLDDDVALPEPEGNIYDDDEEEGDYAPVVLLQQPRQVIGNFTVPAPYQLWGDGIWKKTVAKAEGFLTEEDMIPPSLDESAPESLRSKERGDGGLIRIFSQPLWITSLGEGLTDGTMYVEISFVNMMTRQVASIWVENGLLADHHKILRLSNRGLLVTSNNARGLVAYLEKSLAQNATRLPQKEVASKLGWVEGTKVPTWITADYSVGVNSVIQNPIDAEDLVFQGYGVGGDEDAWFDRFRQVCSWGVLPRWLTMSAFAAPLLRPCGRRNFIIHHGAQSRSAKSALMRFGGSVWCDPERSVTKFIGTQKGITERIGKISDLPSFLDEREAADRDFDFSKFIYQVSLGQDRFRLESDGGIQVPKGAAWRTVLRTTGEGPIVGTTKVDRGGQANRVLQFRATGFLTYEQGNTCYRWTDGSLPPYGQHYGWGGLRFLQKLQIMMRPQNRDKLTELSRRVDRVLDRPSWAPMVEKVVHLGSVLLGQYLASVWLLGMSAPDAWAQGISDAEYIAELLLADVEQTAKHWEEGLDWIRDSMLSEPRRWLNRSEPADQARWRSGEHHTLLGIVSPQDDELWLIQSAVNSELAKVGIERSIWNEFDEQDILITPAKDPRRRKSTAKIPSGLALTRSWGVARKMYVLRLPRVLEGATTQRGEGPPPGISYKAPDIVMDI